MSSDIGGAGDSTTAVMRHVPRHRVNLAVAAGTYGIISAWHLNENQHMLSIQIPKPCQENWNEMLPRGQGAFCNVCAKVVVDFTSMTDEELKNYFVSHRGQQTCGRFRNDQLSPADPLPAIISGDLPGWKKFLAIVVVLFAGFLTGCNDSQQGKALADGAELKSGQSSREDLIPTLGFSFVEISEQTGTDLCSNQAVKADTIFTPPAIVGEYIETTTGVPVLPPDTTVTNIIDPGPEPARVQDPPKDCDPKDTASKSKTIFY